jgi:hypothetical protein
MVNFPSEQQLRAMSVAQIKKHIREYNEHYAIKGYSRLTKDQLISTILTAQLRVGKGKPTGEFKMPVKTSKKPEPKKETMPVKKEATKKTKKKLVIKEEPKKIELKPLSPVKTLKPLTGVKTKNKIKFRVYDDDIPTRGGFDRDDKLLVFKGEIDQSEKKIKLDFFINKGLPKGESTKQFCKYIKYLNDNGFVQDDFRLYLFADPSFGVGGNAQKLIKYYESLSFKKFGEVGFGNQPMETTVKQFLSTCKSRK